MPTRAYCAFEDRPNALVGVKLLALSLERHCRDFTFYIAVARDLPEFAVWLEVHAPHAVLLKLPPFTRTTIKQVKPLVILHLFERGVIDVTWLDTDLLILRDLEPLLAPLDDETILVAQDMEYVFHHNPALLAHYKRTPYRDLKHCVTTAIQRVTAHHRPLLEKLLTCLQDPYFLAQQALPDAERVEGFGYEQKVFEMLISSEGEEGLPVYPIHFISEGTGIVQELGVTTYGVRDRLSNGLGWTEPWILHLAGLKAWESDPKIRRYRSACAYSAFAETYRDQLDESIDWANSWGISSRVARLLSFGQPHWVGLWHCLAGKTVRLLKTGTLRRVP